MLLTSHTECLATYSAQLKELAANNSNDIKRSLIEMSSSIVNDSASPLCLELDDENTYIQIIYQQFLLQLKKGDTLLKLTSLYLGGNIPNVSKYSTQDQIS